MLLVFASHFLEAYYDPFPLTRPHAFQLVTRIATPSFVLISGVTLAVLFARSRGGFAATRDRLVDRGLFLILVGHPLFMVANRYMESSWADAIRVVFITDTIGAAVIVGALVIARAGPRTRLLLGLGLLLAAWTTALAWNPPIPSTLWRVKDLLVGDGREPWLSYNFPPIPWLGLYFVASAAGGYLARAHELGHDRTTALPLRLALVGAAAVAAALLLHLGTRALGGTAAFAGHVTTLALLGSPTHKLPPSPAYILCYGGLALLMFAALLLVQRARLGRAFTNWVVLFGKNSLSAFLFQFYVYYLAVRVMPRPPEALLPVYFLATLILIRVSVKAWQRHDGNRLLTVGYPALMRRLRQRAGAPGDATPVAGAAAAITARAASPDSHGPPPVW
jgi:hypothetical protein